MCACLKCVNVCTYYIFKYMHLIMFVCLFVCVCVCDVQFEKNLVRFSGRVLPPETIYQKNARVIIIIITCFCLKKAAPISVPIFLYFSSCSPFLCSIPTNQLMPNGLARCVGTPSSPPSPSTPTWSSSPSGTRRRRRTLSTPSPGWGGPWGSRWTTPPCAACPTTAPMRF